MTSSGSQAPSRKAWWRHALEGLRQKPTLRDLLDLGFLLSRFFLLVPPCVIVMGLFSGTSWGIAAAVLIGMPGAAMGIHGEWFRLTTSRHQLTTGWLATYVALFVANIAVLIVWLA